MINIKNEILFVWKVLFYIITKLNLKSKNINYKNNTKIKTALISLKIFC